MAHKQPHLTNHVRDDPRVSDQEWALHEGMVSFAGYPLLIEEDVVSVISLFAHTPLSSVVLDNLASVSNAIAISIECKRVSPVGFADLQTFVEGLRRDYSAMKGALTFPYSNDRSRCIMHLVTWINIISFQSGAIVSLVEERGRTHDHCNRSQYCVLDDTNAKWFGR